MWCTRVQFPHGQKRYIFFYFCFCFLFLVVLEVVDYEYDVKKIYGVAEWFEWQNVVHTVPSSIPHGQKCYILFLFLLFVFSGSQGR